MQVMDMSYERGDEANCSVSNSVMDSRVRVVDRYIHYI